MKGLLAQIGAAKQRFQEERDTLHAPHLPAKTSASTSASGMQEQVQQQQQQQQMQAVRQTKKKRGDDLGLEKREFRPWGVRYMANPPL